VVATRYIGFSQNFRCIPLESENFACTNAVSLCVYRGGVTNAERCPQFNYESPQMCMTCKTVFKTLPGGWLLRPWKKPHGKRCFTSFLRIFPQSSHQDFGNTGFFGWFCKSLKWNTQQNKKIRQKNRRAVMFLSAIFWTWRVRFLHTKLSSWLASRVYSCFRNVIANRICVYIRNDSAKGLCACVCVQNDEGNRLNLGFRCCC